MDSVDGGPRQGSGILLHGIACLLLAWPEEKTLGCSPLQSGWLVCVCVCVCVCVRARACSLFTDSGILAKPTKVALSN